MFTFYLYPFTFDLPTAPASQERTDIRCCYQQGSNPQSKHGSVAAHLKVRSPHRLDATGPHKQVRVTSDSNAQGSLDTRHSSLNTPKRGRP